MEVLHDIGKRIMLARRERDLDQTQLAEVINVTQKTISSWETGKSEVGSLDLSRLSQALGKPVSFFFEPFQMVTSDATAHRHAADSRETYKVGGQQPRKQLPRKKAKGGLRKAA